MFLVNNANVTFEDCIFINNSQFGRYLFDIRNKAYVSVNNTQFLHNRDSLRNSRLFNVASDDAKLQIVDSLFQNNYGYGEIIFAESSSTVIINATVFINTVNRNDNTMPVDIISNNHVVIDNSKFYNNTGNIINPSSNMKIQNGYFNGNKQLYFNFYTDVNVEFDNTYFIDNIFAYTMHVHRDANILFNLCHFINNTFNNSLLTNADGHLTINHTIFMQNRAYLQNEKTVMIKILSNNSNSSNGTVFINECKFQDNSEINTLIESINNQ
eukprot:407006_1